MGYKDTEEWTQHEDNFSSLLASLSQANEANQETEIKLSSLEEKSKSSKARVHYKKFTRGKDISRYSEKDLANVFGKKTLKPTKNEIKPQEKIEEENTKEHSYGVETTNRGSMADYFKTKMKNFALETNKESDSDEGEGTVGFGFKSDGLEVKAKKRKNGGEDLSLNENVSSEVVKKTKKKKKSKRNDLWLMFFL